MQTTEQWLDKIKSSDDELTHWLKRQYIGEELAAERIALLQFDSSISPENAYTLATISLQESTHAEWVKSLLVSRGIDIPSVTNEGVRYWNVVIPAASDFEKIAAAGHHAETMRLVRIRALAADPDIASDIRDVFSRILPDEEWHAKVFAGMSNDSAIAFMEQYHEAGLEILGLEV